MRAAALCVPIPSPGSLNHFWLSLQDVGTLYWVPVGAPKKPSSNNNFPLLDIMDIYPVCVACMCVPLFALVRAALLTSTSIRQGADGKAFDGQNIQPELCFSFVGSSIRLDLEGDNKSALSVFSLLLALSSPGLCSLFITAETTKKRDAWLYGVKEILDVAGADCELHQ